MDGVKKRLGRGEKWYMTLPHLYQADIFRLRLSADWL